MSVALPEQATALETRSSLVGEGEHISRIVIVQASTRASPNRLRLPVHSHSFAHAHRIAFIGTFMQVHLYSQGFAYAHWMEFTGTSMQVHFPLSSCSMCRGAEHPGRQLKSKKADLRSPPVSQQAAFSTAWAWQQLQKVAVQIGRLWAIGWLLRAFQRLRPTARSKEEWSLQELGLDAEIGCGRTGRVFEGCINGQPVAVKVCSSAPTCLEISLTTAAPAIRQPCTMQ